VGAHAGNCDRLLYPGEPGPFARMTRVECRSEGSSLGAASDSCSRSSGRHSSDGTASAMVARASTMRTAAHDLPTPDAAQRRLLGALGAAVFMVNLDARVVAPLLPTVADELGVSLARSAWLMSAYMLPYGFAS
jgi:hypothetical protein